MAGIVDGSTVVAGIVVAVAVAVEGEAGGAG